MTYHRLHILLCLVYVKSIQSRLCRKNLGRLWHAYAELQGNLQAYTKRVCTPVYEQRLDVHVWFGSIIYYAFQLLVDFQ